MKQFFTTAAIVLFFTPTALFAQRGNAKITGVVMDSVTQKPVEFANVALTNPDTNVPVDGAVCDENGSFTINKVAPGNYKLLVTFIGFQTKTIDINIQDKRDDVSLGNIIISPTQQVLEAVVVEGEKALIEERVDRTVYNAENDATARGGDATDVLKRVPMLTVDLDGNVSLRGNQNIMVLINNKPSTIMASNVADALKQIPADQIKSVEVITSPSAKYDAEGSAGIINIITKKNTLEGATLNIDSGVGIRGSNLGLNGNFRRGKMGFSLGGWGRANYNVNGRFENEQLTGLLESSAPMVRNIQRADTRSSGLFGHYNLGWDYDINKKNALAASVRFGVRNFNNFQDDLTRQTFENNVLTRMTLANVESRDEANSIDANFTYTHYYDKPQREFSIQGLYSRDNRLNNFQNFYLDPSSLVVTDRLKNLNDSYNQEMTIQADYITPIGTTQMLEFGGKNITRRAISDFDTYTSSGTDGEYVLTSDDRYSNNLNYDQNVTAGYLSYTLTTKKNYSFKVGSRYEYTTIKAYTATLSEDEMPIPSYGVLVPSINASKKLKNGNTLKASYNRRIQRPSIRFLNPNRQFENELNFTEGNPRLDPEYTNNYELGYSTLIKGTMLSITGFARNTTGGIQSVRDFVTIDTVEAIRTTFQNIGKESAYGTSIFANVNIGKLSLNGGGDIFYATLDNNVPDPALRASNSGWVASGRIFGSYNLSKGWGFQFFSFYRGRRVQLQGYQDGFYMYSLAIRKEFNEKRGSVGIGVENFLQRSLKMRTHIESPILVQNSLNERFNASIRLNFSYRIGKMSVDPPRRRRRSISNDDLKDGGGDGMGMSDGGGGGMSPGNFGGGQRAPRPAQKTSAPVAADTASIVYDATGAWDFTIDSPQGGSGVIKISNEGGTYTGTIKTNRMQDETPLQDLKIEKNDVSFTYPVNFGGNSGTVRVNYRISKGEITGTVAIGQFGSFPLEGKKQ